MSLETIRNRLPDYAKDLKLHLGSLAAETALTTQQRAGTFVVAALASRNPTVTRAIMGMNNVYYRFTHLVGGDYPNMPAKLRMNVMAKPGVDKADFELWSLAVSAINGCGMCMESHEKVLLQHGVGKEAVQAAVRIAAVVHAVAGVLDAEDALAGAAQAAAA